MTAVVQERAAWGTMPGWGIVANLLPPEVTFARRVKVLRRLVVAALALVCVLAVAAYLLAMVGNHSAAAAVAKEQSRTAGLEREQKQYSGVLAIQGSVKSVQGQIQSLMASDVDLPTLIASVRSAAPASMTINQISIALSKTASSTGGGTTAGASALDASGALQIGSVTLSGNAAHLTDVSTYVDKLAQIDGVIQPYPTSNRADDAGKGAAWNISFALSSALLSHRFDKTIAPTGSN
ncbi:MAG: hypothetical protein JWN95_397 [Frankiales bacterium]|nr:hypothetical protein [Frankiales bacterium]